MNTDRATDSGPGTAPERSSLGKAGDYPGGNNLFMWFFLGLLFFSLYLMFTVMQPFLHSIILACVFSAISYPFYLRCLKLTKERRVPAAFLVLTSLFFLVVLPICLFIAGLIPQAGQSIAAVTAWLNEGHLTDTISTHLEPILARLQEYIPGLQLDINSLNLKDTLLEASRNAGSLLISGGSYILRNAVLFVVHLLLIFLIMFFFLIDGANMVRRIMYLCPMKPEQTEVVIERLRRISRSVLVGGFLVAALQGVVGGIGLALVGIPALFWGTVMAFAALIPVVGTGLVWVPAVIFLFLTAGWKSALFLTIWCGVGVTSIDSVLRPMLMRDGARVPVLFIFLSILGGVNVFGMLGLLYGPMILAFVAVMLNIYAEEYSATLEFRSGGNGKGNEH
jgi:predicted PurR-regulated permease PerM